MEKEIFSLLVVILALSSASTMPEENLEAYLRKYIEQKLSNYEKENEAENDMQYVMENSIESKIENSIDMPMENSIESESNYIENESKNYREINTDFDNYYNETEMNNEEEERTLTCYGTSGSFTGTEFISLGYNALRGYPNTAGRDPGFKSPIFAPSYNPPKYSSDCKFQLPNGFHFQPLSACETSMSSREVKSQASFDSSLEVNANVEGGGWGVSFAASAQYKTAVSSIENEHKVMVVSMANCKVYYSTLDYHHPPPLAPGFLAALRNLQTKTADEDYLAFLDRHGTHFVRDMTFGARFAYEHEMSSSSYRRLSQSSLSLEVQASYEGVFSLSGGVGMSSEQQQAAENFKRNVKTTTFSVGAQPSANGDVLDWASNVDISNPMPLYYSLESIENLFTDTYFSGTDIDYNAIKSKIQAVKPNFCNRLKVRGQVTSCEPAVETGGTVHVPTWPSGSWGIPKPISGCPENKGFTWHEGWRRHDCEDDANRSGASNPIHLIDPSANMHQYFCMKTSGGTGSWPAGKYCIYRRGGTCPSGFATGSIYWDDEDSNNSNQKNGYLPDGVYKHNTKIEFCCRNDGSPYTEIRLPTSRPFFLLRRGTVCQKVENARESSEFLFFDNEDTNNNDSKSGATPYEDAGSRFHRIHYCYYEQI